MLFGKKIVWKWFSSVESNTFFLIGKDLGKNFKFHNNIDISNEILSKFTSFY